MNFKFVAIILSILSLIVICAFADNDFDNVPVSRYIEYNGGEDNFLNFQGMAVGEFRNAKDNDINFTKKILYINNDLFDINLTFEMPSKPAKLDIVLAMDTSGSMVQNYYPDPNKNKESTYLNWTSDAINTILGNYPDARVSIVSWDDDEENNDCITDFYNVGESKLEIEQKLKSLTKECLETDHTIYSVGINKAVRQLDGHPPTDPYNTSRIIIFVTGLSEFMAEPKDASKNLTLDEQLSNASKNRTYGWNASFYGYQIYPVQIGIDSRFEWEAKNISEISKRTRISNKLPANDPISVENIDNLSEAIENILEIQKCRPIAYDIEVIDALYPYLIYLDSQSQIIHENDSKTAVFPEKFSLKSPVLLWKIGAMNGNDTWEAIIHTKLRLDLPIEVSNERSPVKLDIEDPIYISKLNYTWMTGYRGNISIPEGRIMLSSKNSVYTETGLKNKANATSSGNMLPKELHGFYAILAIIGLSTAKYFYRRWRV